nr:hypothetical protein [Aeromicrobium stalagmiti]
MEIRIGSSVPMTIRHACSVSAGKRVAPRSGGHHLRRHLGAHAHRHVVAQHVHRHLVAGVVEHLDHRVVDWQHVGHEPRRPGPPGVSRRALEQQCRDPLAVLVVRHEEGDLRGGGVTPLDIGHAQDLAVAIDDERGHVRRPAEQVAQVAVDHAPSDREEAGVEVVDRRRLEEGPQRGLVVLGQPPNDDGAAVEQQGDIDVHAGSGHVGSLARS